jgi:hypothetical protein
VTVADTLHVLTGGGDVAAFLTHDWGQRVRHWPGALAGRPDLSLTLDDFETVVRGLNRAHEGWLHFADQGLKPVPPDFADRDGLLDMRRICAAFGAGQTLYLTKADRIIAPLGLLCSRLAGELSGHSIALRDAVNAHVFLTPPGAQGFAPHRDAHASFILQCEGEKHWKIYVPCDHIAEAHSPGGTSPEALARHEVTAVTLRPDDVLYIPEWWPHEASASSRHSLHVTLRIFPLRWCDLMVDVVSRHPALATPVPAGAVPDAELAGSVIALLQSEDFVRNLALHLPAAWTAALGVQPPATRTGELRAVLEAKSLTLDTRLTRVRDVTCEVRDAGDTVALSFGGAVVCGPKLFAPVFDFVACTDRLRPQDLPEIAADYDRLDVARRLVRDGLLCAEATT